jgi:hypothetical protein
MKVESDTYSKPASPARVPSNSFGLGTKGSALDISLSPSLGAPHKSLFRDVAFRNPVVPTGANAQAEPTKREAATAESFMLGWSCFLFLIVSSCFMRDYRQRMQLLMQ